MKTDLYNFSGKVVGDIELPDAVFAHSWNADLVHQALLTQVANRRQTTAHTKNRAEVRGGGRKPWRQKGPGRARHGSIRSPIWKGGGVTHGPLTEKNYSQKINRKMARRALYTVLSAKVRDNEVIILDTIAFSEPKTKQGAEFFKGFVKHDGFKNITKGRGALAALLKRDDTTVRALRNLPFVGIDEARNLTAHEVLQY